MIWLIFYAQEPRFLSSVNLSNLVLQMTAVGLVSIGVVLVLLLGEIDLSVGAVSGLCAAIMAVLNVKHGWSPYLAIAAGGVGRHGDRPLPGLGVHALRDPIVRRDAGRALAWPGAQLEVLGETGTVNLNDPKIVGLTSTFYSDTVGWIIALVGHRAVRGRWRCAGGRSASRGGLSAPQVGLLVPADRRSWRWRRSSRSGC